MSILLFLNLKGGVAKTTNAVAVAECLASEGYRVLVIGADHQCMSGELLLGENRFLHSERPIATAFILPSVPDRLSVRGSLWLLDRIRRMNLKLEGLGTLWSLYRQQNGMHRRIVEAANNRAEPYDQLPRPFKTIIPNAAAIADATEPNRRPGSFGAKYTPAFAKLYRNLCQEIVKRSNWQMNGKADVAAVEPIAAR